MWNHAKKLHTVLLHRPVSFCRHICHSCGARFKSLKFPKCCDLEAYSGVCSEQATYPDETAMTEQAEPTGYWGPQTSTIEWCEENYAVSPYIAEFWNTISSLVMAYVAIAG